MDLNLRGRVALVTGAGQGVGRRIALTLAAEGARIAVNDLLPARAQKVADEIAAAGGTALGLPFDVTDRGAVQAAVEQACARWDTVDILVNNAGIIPERRSGEVGLPPFAEQPPEHWAKIVNLNLMGRSHRRGALCGLRRGEGRAGGHDALAGQGGGAAAHQRQRSVAVRGSPRGPDGRLPARGRDARIQ
jgi:NAD(P)-dependent dehydrogenase (short-subunit alcohol dehydrogenase family)